MGGLFDVFVSQPLWNNVTANPQQAANQLPDTYADIKNRVTTALQQLDAERQRQSALENQVFYPSSLTPEQLKAYNILKVDYETWKSAEQHQFDTLVEQMYLRSIDNSNPTFFTDWYIAQIKTQIYQSVYRMQQAFLRLTAFLFRENELKDNLWIEQNYVIETQKQWMTYLEEQINDQIKLITDLQNLNNTQKRKSQFIVRDVTTYQSLTYWVRLIFWILLCLLALVLLALKLKGMKKVQELAEQAKKMAADGIQAVTNKINK